MVDSDIPPWLEALRAAAENGETISVTPSMFPTDSAASTALERQLHYITNGDAIEVTSTSVLEPDVPETYVQIAGSWTLDGGSVTAVEMTFAITQDDLPMFAIEVAQWTVDLPQLFTRMPIPEPGNTVLRDLFTAPVSNVLLGLYGSSTQGPVISIDLAESDEGYTAFNYLHVEKVGFSILRGCLSAGAVDPNPQQDSNAITLSGQIRIEGDTDTPAIPILIALPVVPGVGTWSFGINGSLNTGDIVTFVTTLASDFFQAADMFGSKGFAAQLPDSLSSERAFMLDDLTLTVRDEDFKLLNGSFAVSAADSWIPVKGVTITDVGLAMSVDLLNSATAQLALTGSVQFGETVFISASVEIPIVLSSMSAPDWVLNVEGTIDMGKDSGIGLDSITMFEGQDAFLQTNDLPSAFLEMDSFVVTQFEVVFNPFDISANFIRSITLDCAANIEAGWEGVLTMNTPRFWLSVQDPFISESRQIEANAGIVLQFGERLGFVVNAELSHQLGETIWTARGENGNPFTLNEAAADVHNGLERVTGMDLDPIVAPEFIGEISIDQIAVEFTTKGPAATVDWAMTFPTLWNYDLMFSGHVGVSYGAANQGQNATPNVAVLLNLDINDDVHVRGNINIGSVGSGATQSTSTSIALSALTDNPFTFAQMKSALNLQDLPDIPPAFDPRMKSMTFGFESIGPTMYATMESETYGKASVLVAKTTAPAPPTSPNALVKTGATEDFWGFGFALNLDKRVDLANLPIFGSFMPASLSFGFDNLALALAYPGLSKASALTLFDQIGRSGDLGEWKGNFRGAIAVDLFVAGVDLPLSFAFGDGSTSAPSSSQMLASDTAVSADAPPATGENTTKWFNLQRSFGPLSVRRIGFAMDESGMGFPMDIALSFGPMMIEADGLQIGLPFEGMSEEFKLSGVGLSFDAPPFYAGAALKLASKSELAEWTAQNGGKKIDFAFSGIAMLRASEQFALSGVGGYAQMSPVPAFFVFAEATAPLGGPPIFQVTGGSAGLGVNYSMRQPGLNEIATNPFVAGLIPQNGGGPLAVLNSLTSGPKPWLRISTGNYWFTIGLKFTIAQTLTTNAVGILSIGDPLQLGLYGISNLSVPKGTEGAKLAEIEIAWMASLQPLKMTLSAGGVLTANSYVLTRSARITGGFWVYLCAAPETPFMAFTIGGFRNGYQLKSPQKIAVPKLERLGFDWKYTKNIHITGGAYFALVPNAMMVGGRLSGSFSFSLFKAWFTLSANFILNWMPETFEGDLKVTVGASVTIKFWRFKKTFKGETNVTINLKGPPLQGTARLKFMGIPIDVSFGDRTNVSRAKKVSWPAFAADLLPPTAERAKVRMGEGEMAQSEASSGPENVASAAGTTSASTQSGFVIVAETVVPIKTLTVGPSRTFEGQDLNIRPTDQSALGSTANLSISRDGVSLTATETANWQIDPIRNDAPQALWGRWNGGKPDLSEAGMVQDQLTGVRISTKAPHEDALSYSVHGGSSGNTAVGMGYEPVSVVDAEILPFPGPADTRGPLLSDAPKSQLEMQTINDSAANRRAALHSALAHLGFEGLPNESLTVFAANADVILPTEPKLTNVTL